MPFLIGLIIACAIISYIFDFLGNLYFAIKPVLPFLGGITCCGGGLYFWTKAYALNENQEKIVRQQRNPQYIGEAKSSLSAIEDFFKSYPMEMGKYVIPSNYLEDIDNYVNDHQDTSLWKDKNLKHMIKEKTEEMQNVKVRFEETLKEHKRALDYYAETESKVKNSKYPHVSAELDLDYQKLRSDHLRYLLADQRWDNFQEVVQTIIDDMKRLRTLV